MVVTMMSLSCWLSKVVNVSDIGSDDDKAVGLSTRERIGRGGQSSTVCVH